jgi:SAM-dependent methyltransferase
MPPTSRPNRLAQARRDPRIATGGTGRGQRPARPSCDLVTVAQALHWFCGDNFIAEVRRVLKPGGLFAAWTYTLLRGDAALNGIVEDFYRNTVGPGGRRNGAGWTSATATCPFPLPTSPCPNSRSGCEWTLDDLLAYLRTWSATQRYLKETGSRSLPRTGERLRESGRNRARARPLSGLASCAAGESNERC